VSWRIAVAMLIVACGFNGIGDPQYCKDYIACYEKTPGAIKGSLDAKYGAMGTCWSTGVQSTADKCELECHDGLQALKAGFPDAGC
jgi:hypothetical protein